MCHRISLRVVAVMLLLLPAGVRAGGPPWLSLPVESATPERTAAAERQLAEKLGDRMWKPDEQTQLVKFQQHGNRWYVLFHLGADVGLGDVETALTGSSISVPRDKLHLFGHVILKIDARNTPANELAAALAKISHVAVDDSKSKDGLLFVTVNMPYPDLNSVRRGDVGFETFTTRLDSDRMPHSADVATAQTLPTYDDFRKVIEQHGANLKDLGWRSSFGCRPLGGVGVPDEATTTSMKQVD